MSADIAELALNMKWPNRLRATDPVGDDRRNSFKQLAAVLLDMPMQLGAGLLEEQTHALRAFMRFLKLAVARYVVESVHRFPIR